MPIRKGTKTMSSPPYSLQNFLADATQKTSDALLAALLNLPAERRGWEPHGKGRSAIDQIAECAIVNGGVVEALKDPASAANYDMGGFESAKNALAADWDTLQTTFETTTTALVAAIRGLPDDSLGVSIELPWGTWTIAHLIGHPYWNMAYHAGQINYISSLID